ncbi:FAD-dependent oxidoreductase [Nonomuraea fuscirosea]|uniref:FAD-dependent oxidoreductase n=1 Tax=Nonomuraea fuscirosea TaxID=1291556 RepID=UPI00342616FB
MLAALSTLGAHREVLATAIPTPRMVMWSGSGKRLGEVANGLRLDDGTVSHTVLRSELYRTVRDEAEQRGIRVSLGKRMISYEDTGSQVTATFEDGTQATGDLLIACDGVRSRTPTLLDPQARRRATAACTASAASSRTPGCPASPVRTTWSSASARSSATRWPNRARPGGSRTCPRCPSGTAAGCC